MGVLGGVTPVASTPLSAASGTGTIHKFVPTQSTDKITKNGVPTNVPTKLVNICAMAIYDKKSMEVSH